MRYNSRLCVHCVLQVNIQNMLIIVLTRSVEQIGSILPLCLHQGTVVMLGVACVPYYWGIL